MSQTVIDFLASQLNASGELGTWAHLLVDTGEETWGTAVALHSPAPQGRSLSDSDAWGAGRGISNDRSQLSLDKLLTRLYFTRAERNAKNMRK